MTKLTMPISGRANPFGGWTPKRALSSLYTGQFLFLGIQLPFFSGWLDAKGFLPHQIGAIFGTALVLRLLLAPVLAYKAEALDDPRIALRLAAASLMVLGLALLLPLQKVLIGMVGVGLLFTFGLLVPLTDTAVLRADRRKELVYGPVRGIGSASFIVANLFGGMIIAATGDQATVMLMAVAGVVTFAAAMSLPREPREEAEQKHALTLPMALKLFRSRSFLLMLLAGGLTQGAHATYYSFSELHWSSLGYSSFLIGCLWTTGVVCEIALLFFAANLHARVSPAMLIIVGGAGALIRWPLVGLSPPLPILFMLQGLHALTFAATYLGTVEFVGRAVPEAYKTTAMTLVSTLGVGAMTGIATVIAGQVFVREAPIAAYGLMGAMGAGAVVLGILLKRRWDGGALSAVPANPTSEV